MRRRGEGGQELEAMNCPKCGKPMRVRDSKRRQYVQVQYLECRECGKPQDNRQIVPADSIRRRISTGRKPA